MHNKNSFTKFVDNWTHFCVPLAIFLIILSPLIYSNLGLIFFLLFLSLPLYMIHQFEEHRNDNYKTYLNNHFGKGRQVLSDNDLFTINVIIIWGILIIVFYLQFLTTKPYGLIIIYLMLVNGITHIISALKQKVLSSGFWTALFLFIPYSIITLYIFITDVRPSILFQLLGIAVVLVIHWLIIHYMQMKIKKLD